MTTETTLASTAAREVQWALRRMNSLDLGDAALRNWLCVRALVNGSVVHERTIRQFLLDGLARLATTNAEGATILRRHYADDVEVHIIARELALVEGTVNKKQREAIAQLAELLVRDEEAARASRQQQLASRLPAPTYTRLFGIDSAIADLLPPLQTTGPPWMLAIDGMGGLGKTALVDHLVRRVLEDARWADVAWVTVRQQVFNAGGAIQASDRPALTPEHLLDHLYDQLLAAEMAGTPLPSQARQRLVRQRLKERPILVVVDNLESADDLQALLTTLREVAGPSKFLMTTRRSLHTVGDVFPYRLAELGEADALALIRWEAQMRNLPALAAARDAELRTVYAVTGGNPLALRLVVGQAHVHALGDVVDDLQRGRGQRSEALYTYIYRRAWENLDQATRAVLLLMPLVAEQGTDLTYLASMSGRETSDLRSALEELVALSLVDRRGGLQESRYTIHSLTRTFLHEQVLRWGT